MGSSSHHSPFWHSQLRMGHEVVGSKPRRPITKLHLQSSKWAWKWRMDLYQKTTNLYNRRRVHFDLAEGTWKPLSLRLRSLTSWIPKGCEPWATLQIGACIGVAWDPYETLITKLGLWGSFRGSGPSFCLHLGSRYSHHQSNTSSLETQLRDEYAGTQVFKVSVNCR